jgi:glycosyltransferase involved in cell wall biosynthesis
LKIAFLLSNNAVGGGNYVALKQADFLASRGHDVEILFRSASHGLDVTMVSPFRPRTRLFEAALRDRGVYDAVVATWWETYYEIFRLEAKRYLYFVQSDERRFYPGPLSPEVASVEYTYGAAGVGLVTEARWIEKMLREEFGAAVEYAPNGIDTAIFRPDVVPVAPRRPDKVRLLIEGPGNRLAFFKRMDFAFEVASRFPECEIWYVSGDGIVRPHWKCDRVFRSVPMKGMPAIYASCDVLLKFSVVEGFFGPPLEMMACGGTAVVSNVTGFDEYIVDGRNALVVSMDDREAAVDAVRRLVNDAALRRRLSEEGVRTARSMDWSLRSPAFERAVLAHFERPLEVAAPERRMRAALNAPRHAVAETRSQLRLTLALEKFATHKLRVFGLYRETSRLVSAALSWPRALLRRLRSLASPLKARLKPVRAPRRAPPAAKVFQGPFVFVGQPEYFRSVWFDATESGEHFEFPITSADPSALEKLPDFVQQKGAKSCIVFRPEWFARYPEAFRRLKERGIGMIGYSTEPVPAKSLWNAHSDLVLRFRNLEGALDLDYDLFIHYDRSSEAFLRSHGFEGRRLFFRPLPVSRRLFYPENLPQDFDACFLGRSTPHREKLLEPWKARYNIVHVAHGLRDEEARELMNRSKVVLNIHNHDYPNFENRVVQALFCGRPVLSEPLSGDYLEAGRDYATLDLPGLLPSSARAPSQPATDLSKFEIGALLAELGRPLP